jgi:hypothetical protein
MPGAGLSTGGRGGERINPSADGLQRARALHAGPICAAPAGSLTAAPSDDEVQGTCRIGFDRIIETDRPIRGTLAAPACVDEGRGAGEGRSTSIRICWHPPIAGQPGEPPIWLLTGDALHFAAPGVADYRCTSALIEVTPIVGARDAMIEALLIATALPAVLWLQGEFMLHAAAIVPHDRLDNAALAIAGASGCGKSRLAAAFLAKGADLVADDSIAVRMVDQDQGSPRCAGLAGGYHLAGQGERAFHPVADGHTRRAARLSAVVVLQDGPRACRTRLGVIDSIEALLANRHRPSVPRRCGLEPRALDDAALLARTVPVYRWPREEADALLDDDIRRTIMRNGGE